MTLTEPDDVDLFARTACPRCDYDLRAGPLEGKCPECGRAYDSQSIILWGWSRKGDGPDRYWSALIWPMVWLIQFQYIILIAAAMIAWSIWRTKISAPTTRVKLSAEGCAQWYAPTMSLINMHSPVVGTLAAFLIYIAMLASGGRRYMLLAAAVFGIEAVRWIILARRVSKARRACREGDEFEENESTAGIIGWERAPAMTLRKARLGTHHVLEITEPRNQFWGHKVFVNATIVCSIAQAESIRRQIERWHFDADQRGRLQNAGAT